METIVIILGLIGLLFFQIWLSNKALGSVQSRHAAERAQLQGKIDILTEHILRGTGNPIDLNRQVRTQFVTGMKAKIAPGWAMDRPATTPAQDEARKKHEEVNI